MRAGRAVVVLLAAVLIIGILAVAAQNDAETRSVTETSTFTTTLSAVITVTSTLNHTETVSVYGGTRLVGNCTVTNYFVPDTVEASSSIITATSGNSTLTYTTYYQMGPTTDTQVSTRYATTIYTNSTGTFTLVSTSTGDYSPSAGWTVTSCLFNG